MSSIMTPNDLAEEIIDGYHVWFVYETAVILLGYLQEKGYCAWETLSKDEVERLTGERPTKEQMERLQKSIDNNIFFNEENIKKTLKGE